jgi:Spy/CpxP family protein refolding chaperone
MKYLLMIMNMTCMNWKNIFRSGAMLLLILLTSPAAFAQGGTGRPGREKLESARIALITEQLDLSPETAQQFWPIYNQLKEKEEALNREEMQMRRQLDVAQLSDAEAKAKLAQYFKLKEEQLTLEQQAAREYQQVLTARQVLQLFKAEADFRRMVLENMGERGRRGGPPN